MAFVLENLVLYLFAGFPQLFHLFTWTSIAEDSLARAKRSEASNTGYQPGLYVGWSADTGDAHRVKLPADGPFGHSEVYHPARAHQ